MLQLSGDNYFFTLMTSFLIAPSPIIGACTSSGKKIANCPSVSWKNVSVQITICEINRELLAIDNI